MYPYLLRDIDIIRPDQVWAADITYVRMKGGHVYLLAIMDYVVDRSTFFFIIFYICIFLEQVVV